MSAQKTNPQPLVTISMTNARSFVTTEQLQSGSSTAAAAAAAAAAL
jgi:hypothetical protein